MKTANRMLSWILSLSMIVSLMLMAPVAAQAVDGGTTKTIYFDATGSGWTNVNAYAWTDDFITNTWPGLAMTKVSSHIYACEIPASSTRVIFNNGSSQTPFAAIPTDGKNQYNYSGEFWSTYSPDLKDPDDVYYLFWNNSDGSISHNGWDTPFVGGKTIVTFTETMYVWVASSVDGVQYMTDGWQGDATSVTMYPQANLTKPDLLMVPAGTYALFLSDNGDGSLTLSYDDGKNPTLILNYPSLSFEDEILYNVYYTIDNTASVVEMGLLTFSSRLVSGTIDDAVEVIPGYVSDGTAYMVRSNGIPAKNLSDTVYFKVYAKLTDGSYIYSEVAGYNAVAYANTVLNGTGFSTEVKSLVVAMLNYGAAAQVYFGYKTDSLMNAFLTPNQKALASAYTSAMVADVVKADSAKVGSFVMNGGYSDIYPTVSFEGAFAINFYFTPSKTVDSAPTMYYWDSATYNSASKLNAQNATGTLTMTRNGDNWGAAVEGISAKDVDSTIYVAGIYSSDGTNYSTGIISYSLGDYCKTVAAKDGAFGAATAVYGFYAKLYFNPAIADGVYRIKNAHTGLYLGTHGGTDENTPVELLAYAADGLEQVQQLWTVRKLDNGYYAIRPLYKPDMALHVSSNDVDITTVGTTDWYDYVPADNRWTIAATLGGYHINHAGTGSMAMQYDNGVVTKSDSGMSNGSAWTFESLVPPASSDYLLNVEFSFDHGAAEKFGGSAMLSRCIINRNFLSAANAFAEKCGVYLVNNQGELDPYYSDADNCPTASNYRDQCRCTDDCTLQWNHDISSNNSGAGFQQPSHCKNIARLRNNLIVDIPDNTIRVTYSGHQLCYTSGSSGYKHSWSGIGGLADYGAPIIAICNKPTFNASTLAHEMAHLFDVYHHTYDENDPCIMSTGGPDRDWFDPDDPDTYWCSNCIQKIIRNKTKFSNSGDAASRTIYFDNSGNDWEMVNAFTWNAYYSSCTGPWPGTAMTLVSDSIYSIEVPPGTTYINFNDGTSQSMDLTIPTSGNNLYHYITNTWSEYSSECSHNYTSSVTEVATCTTAGLETYTCTKCYDSYTKPIAALGHQYSLLSITHPDSEAEVKTYICDRCSYTYTPPSALLTATPMASVLSAARPTQSIPLTTS